MDYATWSAVGDRIVAVSNASAWWLGDWLLYGQRAYGHRYRAAVDRTGLDYQTLRNYAWVARQFPQPRRRRELSFQHHAEVASLPEVEQDLWLQRAARAGWSRNRLRRHLTEARRPASNEVVENPAVEDDPIILRIEVPTHRERRWRQAAEAVDQSLSDWMATMADLAAAATLDGNSAAKYPPIPEPSSTVRMLHGNG